MKNIAQDLGTTEKHACVCGRVDLADGFENGIPVRAAEVGGRFEARDGVGFGVGVVDHDVGGVVGFDVGG